jgi:hypothetical protein
MPGRDVQKYFVVLFGCLTVAKYSGMVIVERNGRVVVAEEFDW